MLITISRQFAAGGSQVASRVAEALGWRLVDDELVDRVAERAGVSREEVAALEERAPTFIERLARLTALELPELFLPTAEAVEEFGEGHLVKITRALVEELAAEGRCVVVGRASAAVLARSADTLHVRLVAPFETRVKRPHSASPFPRPMRRGSSPSATPTAPAITASTTTATATTRSTTTWCSTPAGWGWRERRR